jgi:uncharacterized protein
VIRVVLDTNVVVSAVLRPGRNPSSILQLCLGDPGFQLAASEELLNECEEVLRRPRFGFSVELVDRLMSVLREQTVVVSPAHSLDHLVRDRSDAKVIECAIESGAQLLVTGNRKLFIVDRHGPTRIVTPAQFVEIVLG